MGVIKQVSLIVSMVVFISYSQDHNVSDIPGIDDLNIDTRTQKLNDFIKNKTSFPDGHCLKFNMIGGVETVYEFGSIVVDGKNGISIVVDQGVTLKGSDNDVRDDFVDNGPAEGSFIYIKSSPGITITGGGTIDGNVRHWGSANYALKIFDKWWESSRTRNVDESKATNECIYIKDCKSLSTAPMTISDITIKEAYTDAICLRRCENVNISGVKINNYIYENNENVYYTGGDGIDIDLSKNVTITGAVITSSDDAICIKSAHFLNNSDDEINSENITITGCTVASPTNGLKIGSETCDAISNVKFINCDVNVPLHGSGPFGGVSIEAVDGSRVSDILVQNVRIHGAKAPIFVKVGSLGGKRDGHGQVMKIEDSESEIRNITFDHVTADILPNYCSIASSITGYSNSTETVPVYNVTLKDVTFVVKGGVGAGQFINENDVGEYENKYPESNMFQFYDPNREVLFGNADDINLPCFGIFFRHVRGLSMKNVNISFLNSDARPNAFIYKDVVFDPMAPIRSLLLD